MIVTLPFVLLLLMIATGPLMYPLDVNQHFDTFFLLYMETGYFFDANDREYGHLVNAGRRFSDGDLRLNGFDLVKEYTDRKETNNGT